MKTQARPDEREQWAALTTVTTLPMMPQEALIASVRHLARRLLDLTFDAHGRSGDVDWTLEDDDECPECGRRLGQAGGEIVCDNCDYYRTPKGLIP